MMTTMRDLPTDVETKYSVQLANGTEEEKQAALIALRIVHLLTYFPKLTHSMLQIGLGTALQAKVWRPILDEMIVEGEINIETVSATTPTGRQQTYTIIALASETGSE